MARFEIVKFRVIGRGDFPMDMLRYDAAWPHDSESASKMQLSLYEQSDEGQRKWLHNRRVITLSCIDNAYKPTVARWSSFGWSVVDEHQFNHMNDSRLEEYFNPKVIAEQD